MTTSPPPGDDQTGPDHDGTEVEGPPGPGVYPPSPPWSDMAKLTVVIMGFTLIVIGVYLTRHVLGVAALAALIAFLVAPLIRFGHRKLHLPRGLALVIAYLLVFIGTILFGYLVISSIVESIIELDPIGLVNDARLWLLDSIDENNIWHVFGLQIDMSSVMNQLTRPVDDGSASGVIDFEELYNLLSPFLSSFRTVAGFIVASITSAIVTVLIAMYLNADSERFHATSIKNFPSGYERDAWIMFRKQKRVWTGYLYGQLVNSLITGTLVFIVLWAVGLPGAFLFGMIMVVLNMIPTFGPILAAIPGVLAALLSGSTRWPDLENYWFALLIAGIYLVVVQAQANIIAPKVMGTAVQLRPAIVLVGLLVGFQVGGLLGSLLAVPVIASIRDVAVYLWAKLLDKDPFPDERPVPIPDG
ncbi:MAG: AI-2E family transporter [Acidimicrobiia bacterium]|nr:AI-2E family transporter [Acidimicrobiia bacterium]